MRFMARQSLAVAVMKLKFQSVCDQLLNPWGQPRDDRLEAFAGAAIVSFCCERRLAWPGLWLRV